MRPDTENCIERALVAKAQPLVDALRQKHVEYSRGTVLIASPRRITSCHTVRAQPFAYRRVRRRSGSSVSGHLEVT
jgi:hypothetical protein